MTTGSPARALPNAPFLVRAFSKRGIFYGWAIVVASFVVTFCEMPTFNPVLTLFLLPMTQEFGWSRTEFSGVVVISTFAAAIVAPFGGALVDRVGPRLALVAGSALLGIAILALAVTPNLVWFYFCYALARIAANGGTGIATTVVVSNWFTHKRAFAFGIIASAWRLGSWVLPLGIAALIFEHGWRAGWAALGVMILLLAVPIPALLTIRAPQDVGLSPLEARSSTRPRAALPERSWTLRDAVRTTSLWFVALSGFCAWFTAASFNLHLAPYLLDKGYPPDIAVGTLAGMGFVSMVATIGMGLVADRIGVRPTYMLAFASATVGAALLLWLAASWMLLGFAIFYGVAFGGYVTLQQSVWAEYFGRGSLGAIRGVAMPVQLMGNALGPFLAAVAYDLTGSYALPFAAFVLVSLLGIVAMGLARKPRHPALA
ncbi:MAG: MFS transporter [Chloroflexota bacterium]|nr:MFS transporter [Dehalococcoidia bacterium]MDW8254531.1 MFS transporter [Chloroflexota bacterium]